MPAGWYKWSLARDRKVSRGELGGKRWTAVMPKLIIEASGLAIFILLGIGLTFLIINMPVSG
jgi:hypothetical protein